jgi:hypothetical protein
MPGTPRGRATRTWSCWLRARGTALSRTAGAEQPGPSARPIRGLREAIALRPDRPAAYYNLGAVLNNSGHFVEAAQRFLEAKERYEVGSSLVGLGRGHGIGLRQSDTGGVRRDVAKPEWWNDEGLKALSAQVVRAAPRLGWGSQPE